MKIKAKPKKGGLVPQGTMDASLASIIGKPDDVNPKKLVGGFKIPSYEDLVVKEWPVALDPEMPLRKDVETLLGKELTASEAEAGIDTKILIGKTCQIVVAHKSGAGGKTIAYVSVVLPGTAAQLKAQQQSGVQLGEGMEIAPVPLAQTEEKTAPAQAA